MISRAHHAKPPRPRKRTAALEPSKSERGGGAPTCWHRATATKPWGERRQGGALLEMSSESTWARLSAWPSSVAAGSKGAGGAPAASVRQVGRLGAAPRKEGTEMSFTLRGTQRTRLKLVALVAAALAIAAPGMAQAKNKRNLVVMTR